MATPTIVSRAQAGLEAPRGPYAKWPDNQPSGCTIHWEGAGGHEDHRYCAREWLAIQLYLFTKGYIDIAYHWGVCQHGVVFEGRPVGVQSAAQNGGNKYRIAICYIGGPLTPFTQAARNAIVWLVNGRKAIPHADEPSVASGCAGLTINTWVRNGLKGADDPRPVPQPGVPNLPLPPNGVQHPVLYEGRVGPAVVELQVKLYWGANQKQVVPDGVFGPKTKEAVLNFQRFFSLEADGIVGPKTWGLLDYITERARAASRR